MTPTSLKAAALPKRFVVPICVATSSLYAIFLGSLFSDNTYRWPMFCLWFFPVICFVIRGALPCQEETRETIDPDKEVSTRERWIHLVVILVFALPYVLFLSSYPYIAIHDEVRDGGLRGAEIASGALTNIFGRDWSQGLTFATLTSFLYHIFGPSVLTYRSLGAVAAVLHISLIYFGFRRLIGSRAALIAAVIVASNHPQLFFSRTESLITLSSLAATLTFFFLARLLRAHGESMIPHSAYLGTVVGISVGMHASAKASALFALTAGILSLIIRVRLSTERWCHAAPAVVALLVFIVVGIGPQALYLTWETLSSSEQSRLDLPLSEIIKIVISIL